MPLPYTGSGVYSLGVLPYNDQTRPQNVVQLQSRQFGLGHRWDVCFFDPFPSSVTFYDKPMRHPVGTDLNSTIGLPRYSLSGQVKDL